MSTKPIISHTAPDLTQTPRVDLWKKGFDALVWNKGSHVTWERAIKCPCKEEGGTPLNTCRNCRGLGWIFTEKVSTRMVISSINRNTKVKSWSVEMLGTASVTALAENSLSFMDRITLTDAEAVFQEVVYPREYLGEELLDKEGNNLLTKDDEIIMVNGKDALAFLTFPAKEVEYIATFVDANTPLQKLTTDDYSISNNYISFSSSFVGKGITIRYTHSPQYLILDLTRELMQSQVVQPASGREELTNLPIHAIAKRLQYVFDAENTTSNLMVYNNID